MSKSQSSKDRGEVSELPKTMFIWDDASSFLPSGAWELARKWQQWKS